MANGPFYEIGRYYGRVTRQKLGQTSTGKPQFVLSFLVLGKINPEDPGGNLLPVNAEFERTIFRVITENTVDYLTQDLEALGFTGSSYSQLDEDSPNCCNFIGKELEFFCNHEARQIQNENGEWVSTNEAREKWGIARASTGPNVKPLEQKQVRQLDAMFGKALKKFGESEKPASGPSPALASVSALKEEAKAAGDDDIPF